MNTFLTICKVVGACSVLMVFGAVLYLLWFETWQGLKDIRATKAGMKRLSQIIEQNTRTGGVYDHDLERLWALPAVEPRRRRV